MRHALIFALAPLLACDDKGDILGCTEIGCVDGFDLPFSPALSTQGAYTITVVADGATITCSGTLPLPSDGSFPCDADDVGVGTSGSALSEDQHEVTSLFFTSSPTEVSVSIDRDGSTVAEGDFSPTYEISQPNGEDCPPTCSYANETLQVDDP